MNTSSSMNEEIVPVVKKGNADSGVCSIGNVYCIYSSIRGKGALPGCANTVCTDPARIFLYRTEALKLALRGHPDLD